MPKKKITITVICETNKDNKYIETALVRGTFRALDQSPYYVAAPGSVESISVDIKESE